MSDEGINRYLTTKVNETAEVLRRARARVDTPEKWCKYRCRDNAGAMCAFGAINYALTGSALQLNCHTMSVVTVFEDAAGTRNIAVWNNAPERTHAEVLAAFDRAIQLAEAS